MARFSRSVEVVSTEAEAERAGAEADRNSSRTTLMLGVYAFAMLLLYVLAKLLLLTPADVALRAAAMVGAEGEGGEDVCVGICLDP
mmetsp:Transcript_30555/g.68316  ORF Transcript_30555/g.68316 Transcript_30555/m.68316 type:complete len:86 (+) Transcript_30555:106-363(+)